MKLFLKFFLLTSITTTLLSCGVTTHEERQERRADAFDISGAYNISSENGLKFEIINEGERSNVYAEVKRDGFSKGEEEAFTRQNIPLNRVDYLRTNLKIGKGKDIIASMSGGENISTDGGETSKLSIYSYYSPLDDNSITITYSINATMVKSTATLSGTFKMSIGKRTVVDGKSTYTVVDGYETSFKTNNGQSFSSQYMGTWNGSFETSSASEIASAFSNINFSMSGSMVTIKSALNSFSYNGENFAIANNTKALSTFTAKHPVIYFEFLGNRGSRVQVSGTVYSLGRFSGTVMLSDGTQLGSFNFSKK